MPRFTCFCGLLVNVLFFGKASHSQFVRHPHTRDVFENDSRGYYFIDVLMRTLGHNKHLSSWHRSCYQRRWSTGCPLRHGQKRRRLLLFQRRPRAVLRYRRSLCIGSLDLRFVTIRCLIISIIVLLPYRIIILELFLPSKVTYVE